MKISAGILRLCDPKYQRAIMFRMGEGESKHSGA